MLQVNEGLYKSAVLFAKRGALTLRDTNTNFNVIYWITWNFVWVTWNVRFGRFVYIATRWLYKPK